MSSASQPQVVYSDAVLFDMDGTLTDSISAVEAAWSKVANDIGQDPDYVIAATHGKRAVDNLSQFKPHLQEHEVEKEVEKFEESILFFADAHKVLGERTSRMSANAIPDGLPVVDEAHATEFHSSYTPYRYPAIADSSETTPSLTPGSSAPISRRSSIAGGDVSSRRPSFGTRLFTLLGSAFMSGVYEEEEKLPLSPGDDIEVFSPHIDADVKEMTGKDDLAKIEEDLLEAWQIEAASVDRSVKILPGVRKMIDSIPEGRYAVATSGAKTYAYGCMSRVGITPPAVTITADDKRLKAGKPAPDPFLLAAECLGFPAERCIVFEDSPSGIKAGVASGATVIAVCTSHDRKKIEGCGAHFIVENMESVKCEVEEGRLKFTILA